MPATTPRRRKIFPHLDEANKSSSEASSSGADNDDSKTKPDDYDNDKSKKGKKQHPSARSAKSSSDSTDGNKNGTTSSNAEVSIHHLLPLPLVLTVLVCSGLFWIASFRDVFATGKPMLDTLGMLWGQEDADANFLEYTKSTAWYDNSRGWKSKQGGLSTIMSATSDANNMGGLYIRKMSGVAGLAFHTTKIWPIIFQSAPRYDKAANNGRWTGASWSAGHYDPVLTLGLIGDVCISMFYLARLDELKIAGAQGIGMAFILTSLVEAFIFGMYLLSRRMNHRATKPTARVNVPTGGYNPQEDPNSLPSRIVARTTVIVSGLISLISLRDVFFPGTILSFVPRDDIYLEWTGAFLHSPPPDTIEADEHGLEAPLFAGDKFVAQLLGMYLSLGCMFKLLSAWGWSKGNRSMGTLENVDRSGVVTSKMIWKAQSLGNVLLLGLLRMFTPAAQTASLDLRWHLMLVAYEAFILGLYGFW
mmetsp:Transcript_22607/g.48952  ORF Transcript_22607/g.48952 Transcript_22607/m.48952 type:complete len:475 (+) Transcript_22607:120-1544(+)|eukprot:CAMPEP_0172318464 /NCGR_PEP_ID=MMETSP1058-20130122/34949_1 /TAXON_ID=83371 /ORGANISM="Detonula confervacea, Strain CCMP 353" /LENGTH=474 /DNA_ID=CAMNT_0013033307 /DNA_START=109 /DNA_END=1533 /DNA_ORIENTATION=+